MHFLCVHLVRPCVVVCASEKSSVKSMTVPIVLKFIQGRSAAHVFFNIEMWLHWVSSSSMLPSLAP